MKLSYKDGLPGEEAKRKQIEAEITTSHPASSYGQPALVLTDGGVLDLLSWRVLNYSVEEASKEELVQFDAWWKLQTYLSTGAQTEL